MSAFVHPDEIRSRFSAALSAMYRAEVPQYGDLLTLVADINAQTLKADAGSADRLAASGELARLSEERHGAIRLGTADELATIARAFAVMGMEPVSYYNLAPAGVPVHSTAFRPVDPAALARNPFRVFTSLLRLELIEDDALRAEAAETMSASGRSSYVGSAGSITWTACRTADVTPAFSASVRTSSATKRGAVGCPTAVESTSCCGVTSGKYTTSFAGLSSAS